MNLIVAVDENWGIGNNGELLVHNPKDLKNFKSKTLGNVIIMGRKTLESLPGGRPLNGRINIVLTKNLSYRREDTIICHSMEQLQQVLKNFTEDHEVYVIGGGSIYQQLLPYCDTAYITKIKASFPADTTFPNLDADPNWTAAETSDVQEYQDISYYFVTYKRKK